MMGQRGGSSTCSNENPGYVGIGVFGSYRHALSALGAVMAANRS